MVHPLIVATSYVQPHGARVEYVAVGIHQHLHCVLHAALHATVRRDAVHPQVHHVCAFTPAGRRRSRLRLGRLPSKAMSHRCCTLQLCHSLVHRLVRIPSEDVVFFVLCHEERAHSHRQRRHRHAIVPELHLHADTEAGRKSLVLLDRHRELRRRLQQLHGYRLGRLAGQKRVVWRQARIVVARDDVQVLQRGRQLPGEQRVRLGRPKVAHVRRLQALNARHGLALEHMIY
mmetsp:Transcript_14079/g.40856  ORF Transcript_14079/g.40856 Transcript_14079/m.40856 type:complete len:231 (+) Transcript_14079:881-1573(+)